MYRSGIASVNSLGQLVSIAKWLGEPTDNLSVAMAQCRTAITAPESAVNCAVVIKVVGIVKVRRSVEESILEAPLSEATPTEPIEDSGDAENLQTDQSAATTI